MLIIEVTGFIKNYGVKIRVVICHMSFLGFILLVQHLKSTFDFTITCIYESLYR